MVFKDLELSVLALDKSPVLFSMCLLNDTDSAE